MLMLVLVAVMVVGLVVTLFCVPAILQKITISSPVILVSNRMGSLQKVELLNLIR